MDPNLKWYSDKRNAGFESLSIEVSESILFCYQTAMVGIEATNANE